MLLSRRRAVIRCLLCVKIANARIGYATTVATTRMTAVASAVNANAKSVQAVKTSAREINKCLRFIRKQDAPSVLGSLIY